MIGSCIAGCGRSASGGKPMCPWCWPYVAPRVKRAVGAARSDEEYAAAVVAAIKSCEYGKRYPHRRGVPSRVEHRRRYEDGVYVRRAVAAGRR